MKRQYSIVIGSSIKSLAVPLMCAGMFLSSLNTAAQDPIPFKAMMQSASEQAAVPSRSDAGVDAQTASGQQSSPNPKTGPITAAGRTEIGVGFLLIAAGVATISITALLRSSGFSPSASKTSGLYVAGAGATAGGVTLIALGFHRHKAR